jgi:hypothetical protein
MINLHENSNRNLVCHHLTLVNVGREVRKRVSRAQGPGKILLHIQHSRQLYLDRFAGAGEKKPLRAQEKAACRALRGENNLSICIIPKSRFKRRA